MSDLEERTWGLLFAEIGMLRLAEETSHPKRALYIVQVRESIMHIWNRLNHYMRMDP